MPPRRAAGGRHADRPGLIADLLSAEPGARGYDYMDFYMGTVWIADRADLTPVFTAIFRRLVAQGCDWRYIRPGATLRGRWTYHALDS